MQRRKIEIKRTIHEEQQGHCGGVRQVYGCKVPPEELPGGDEEERGAGEPAEDGPHRETVEGEQGEQGEDEKDIRHGVLERKCTEHMSPLVVVCTVCRVVQPLQANVERKDL